MTKMIMASALLLIAVASQAQAPPFELIGFPGGTALGPALYRYTDGNFAVCYVTVSGGHGDPINSSISCVKRGQ
jgi:hypothetical protein